MVLEALYALALSQYGYYSPARTLRQFARAGLRPERALLR